MINFAQPNSPFQQTNINQYGVQPPVGMMGGNQPGMQGKWTSKKTGKTVIVRDMISSSNGMEMLLSDGLTIPMAEFSNEYIQISDEEYDDKGNIIGISQMQNAPIQQENPYNAEDYAQYYQQPMQPNEPVNKNLEMVAKVFDTKNPNIDINLDIKTDNFPINELAMLNDVFGVTYDEIAEYVATKYINIEKMKEVMKNYISKLLGIDDNDTNSNKE